MRSKINHLISGIIGIIVLFAFVQCDNAVDSGSSTSSQTEPALTNSGRPGLSIPELTAPEDGSQQPTAVTLEWQDNNPGNKVKNFRIQLSIEADFSSTLVDSSTSSSSFEIEGLPSDTTIQWRVKALSNNQQSDWSESQSFMTEASSEPITTTLQSPEDGATVAPDTSAQWTSVASADSYHLQVATDQSFSSTVVDKDTDNSSYQFSSLETGQTYYWRVEPTVDGEQTEWSNVRDFQTESSSTNDGSSSSSGSVAGDRQALMDLYNATGGSGWSNNSGWGSGDPSDSWYGVEVNAEGRVVRLDLFQNGLSGNLPESIGNLTALTYLNVKGNALSGEIPSTIGDMSSLEWLVLAGNPSFAGQTTKEPPQDLTTPYHQGKSNSATNDFSGAIPSTIGQLSNLKRLELSGTSISSLPEEIGNCTALEGLYINWSSNLNQALPSTIGNLTQLRHLYMAEDQLTGDLPASMSNLTNLTFLDMGSLNGERNQLTGELPDFSGATDLRFISMDQNNLSGEWPSYWNSGDFPYLRGIRATWNNFTGTLHSFNNLTDQLKVFDLTGNSLTGELPPSITQLGRSIILGLGWNDLSGELPQSGWADFTQLRLIYLNDNNFTGNIPGDFFDAIDNPDLKWVYLQNNNFTSYDKQAMDSISSSSLQTIDISGNDF